MKESVLRIIVKMMRILHIIHIFGFIDGLKYIYYYQKIRKSDNLSNSGKKIKLRYAHENLLVRTNSTDLLLIESIIVGKFVNGKWVGEYCQVEEYMKKIYYGEPVVIDAGSNIGLFSRLILKEFPNARIYAIEPEEHNYHILEENIKNYMSEMFRGGVWSHDCNLRIIPRDTGDWGFMVQETNEHNDSSIRAVSINSLVERYQLDRIDLLKMDVEGSEFSIFSSENLEWINLCKAIVIETHDHIAKGSDELVNKVLTEKGFAKNSYEENQLFTRA